MLESNAQRNTTSASRREGLREERTSVRPLETWLKCAVDLGIASLILVAPLFMGGRSPLGKLVFVALVGITATLWLAHQCCRNSARWYWTGLEWIFLGALALVGLQLMPLSQDWLYRLSPAIPSLLPVITSGQLTSMGIEGWSQVSLNPSATTQSLTVFIAYVLLFYVVFQRVQRIEDAHRLLKTLAVGAIVMAVIGIAQRVLGNGKFLWLYANPERTTNDLVKGTFFNQNHFAHCLALGLAPLLWWTATVWKNTTASDKSSRRSDSNLLVALCVAVGVVLLAGLLTISRGGILALCVSTAVTMGLLAHLRLINGRAIVVSGAVAAALILAVSIYGFDQLSSRVSDLSVARSVKELSAGRVEIWNASGKAGAKFAILGAGGGTFSDVYPIFLTRNFVHSFEYAENGYLNLLVEYGIPGLAFALTALVTCLWSCLYLIRASHEPRMKACVPALAAGIVVSCLHSFVDFVWFIPACMTFTICLAAIAWKLGLMARESVSFASTPTVAGAVSLPRGAWAAATVGACLLSVWLVGVRLPSCRAQPAWEQYHRLDFQRQKEFLLGDSTYDTTHEQETSLLERVVRLDPNNVQARVLLASLYLLKFNQTQLAGSEARFDLANLREAALDSFTDLSEQEQWLRKAVGDEQFGLLSRFRKNVREAIQKSPLSGLAYLFAARVKFMYEPGKRDVAAIVNQGTRLRPTAGPSRYNMIKEAALKGELDGLVEVAKLIYRENPRYRGAVVRLFLFPHRFKNQQKRRSNLERFVKHLKPDRQGLYVLYRTLRKGKMALETKITGSYYLRALMVDAEKEAEAVAKRTWQQACDVALAISRFDVALKCSNQLIELDSDSYQGHRTAALALTGMGRDDEAKREIAWCRQQRPFDEDLQKAVTRFQRELLQAGRPQGVRR